MHFSGRMLLILMSITPLAQAEPWDVSLSALVNQADFHNSAYEEPLSGALEFAASKNAWGGALAIDFIRDFSLHANSNIELRPEPFVSLQGTYSLNRNNWFVRPGIGISSWSLSPGVYERELERRSGTGLMLSLQTGIQINSLRLFANVSHLDNVDSTQLTRYGLGIGIHFSDLKGDRND